MIFSSSKNIIDKRKDLFKQVKDIQDNFTSYEYFLYNDGQNYSTASAPGIGTNLAGTEFTNKFSNNTFTSSHDIEGFDTVYKKTSTNTDYLHLLNSIFSLKEGLNIPSEIKIYGIFVFC